MTAIDTILGEPAVQAIGWALVHFVWQGTLIAAIAALAFRALRGCAPDVRYVVGVIALAVMATLPVVSGLQAWQAAAGAAPRAMVTPPPEVVPPSAIASAAEPRSAATSRSSLPAAAVINSDVERWIPLLVGAWMTGVLLLALRLVGGWLLIERAVRRRIVPAAPALEVVVQRLARRLHITRPVRLLMSPAMDVPTVIGSLKPTVLLPMAALSGLSPVQIEAILAHELAHIRRHDYFVNLLQAWIETLLFYHPGVWWLSGRVRAEREHCCDDLAVSLCGDPIVYARALADLEDLRRHPAAHLVIAATGGPLLARIRRLVAAPATHAGRGPAWLAASAAVVLMLGVVLGAGGGRHAASTGELPVERDLAAAGAPPDSSATAADQQWPPSAPMASAAPPPQTAWAFGEAADAGSSVRAQTPPAPPAVPAPPAAPAPPPGSVTFEGSRQESSGHFTWTSNGETLEVKYRGSFELNDDDTDVVRMSPGSYLRIGDGRWLQGASIEFRADDSGNITRRFYQGSSERPFEPGGREWLKANLPRFVRMSGFDARGRVARFYKRGGVEAVLEEIARIESGYAKKVYYSELLRLVPADPAVAQMILAQAAREITSDYEMAALLIGGADKLLLDEGSRRAYFDAARTIDSDYELKRVLSSALKRGRVSPALLAGMLDTARGIGSDYEVASLLVDVARDYEVTGGVTGPFFALLDTVGSSYERGRVLQAVLKRGTLPPDALQEVLRSTATMSGHYETGQVLQLAARTQAIVGQARDAYLEAAHRLPAYEQNQALAALVRSERRQ